MSEAIHVDRQVDVKGMLCPMPVISVKRGIKDLQRGQVLAVSATDKGACRDIPVEMAPLLPIFIFIIMPFPYVIIDTKFAKRRCLNGYHQRLLRLCGCTGLSTPHALRKITSKYFMIATCHSTGGNVSFFHASF